MTKTEKIAEIIREYENGIDKSIDASDILEGIKNVLDAPERDYDRTMSVITPAGELCAAVTADTYTPGVVIYLRPKDATCEINLAYAEVKSKELADIYCEKGKNIGYEDVSLYAYGDPRDEDFTYSAIIKRAEVLDVIKEE